MRGWIELFQIPKLIFGLLVVMLYYVAIGRLGLMGIVGLSALPILVLVMIYTLNRPIFSYGLLISISFVVFGLSRYVPSLPIGSVIDGMLALSIFSLILSWLSKRDIEWIRLKNCAFIVSAIWGVYCLLQVFNPESVSTTAWFTSVRGIGLYFVLTVFIVNLSFKRFKHLKGFLILLSILTLVAVAKAVMQKYVGFDAGERRWLYVEGGAVTHIIWSGIRYFSLFSDASNFGAGMGLCLVVFILSSFSSKSVGLKIYFAVIGLCAFYGLLLSGTRSALAVPFVGFLVYVLISRKIKVIIPLSIVIVGAYFFLAQTNIANGNEYVRKMRSAFDENDPSYQVRLANQAQMRPYLATRPFGVGIGLGGVKALRYNPQGYMSQLPTDSWFVMLWAETGIVGLCINIILMLCLILYGAYLVSYKILNPELRGYLASFLGGFSGITAASYGNELFGQMPICFIIYTGIALVFMGPYFDQQIALEESKR